MAEASDTFGILYQNLKDAGCDAETTEKCVYFVKKEILTVCCRFSFDTGKNCLIQYVPGRNRWIVWIS